MSRARAQPKPMINYTASYTDQYELTMAQLYFRTGREREKAVFDYFFRKLPFEGGFAIFAGLEDLLTALEGFRFDKADLEYLAIQGFPEDFLDYLKDFRFRGAIRAPREGDVVFPTRPILQVEANLIEAQIIETILLNILDYQTLVATKACRMRLVAGKDVKLVDFGLRRSHGPGGYYAARAAYIGGFDSTSNVRAGKDYGIPISGTMAHSFVQSYEREIDAFRDFAKERADDCVLLADTYDTLKSGLSNAILVAKEMEKKGHRLKGVRLDSGDLAELAKAARKMLDEAGLDYVKIAASNQIDEYVIKSLAEQNAPVDLYGVGASLVTAKPEAALDGVYKLAFAGGKPRLKLSETIGKITLPHKKQVYRLRDGDGNLTGADAVALEDEKDFDTIYDPFGDEKPLKVKDCRKEPLLATVMESGRRAGKAKPLNKIREYAAARVAELPPGYKRFENPHVYRVGITEKLKQERDKLIETYRKDE